MQKSAEAFRSIGEVAKLIGVAPHVLRYWETQFPQLKPMKRPDGRRYYRPDDIRLVAGLCEVLRDDGMTIRGAKKLIAKDRGAAIRGRGAERLGEQVTAPGAPEASDAWASPPEKTPVAPLVEKRPPKEAKASVIRKEDLPFDEAMKPIPTPLGVVSSRKWSTSSWNLPQ